MFPAQKCFHTGNAPTGNIALSLIQDPKFVALQRVPQTRVQSEADVVVIWKLDRLSHSLRDVLTIMERIQERKAGFRSLTEAIDTTTPAGRMMMGSFAEFERAMLKERMLTGIAAARKQGRVGGRPPKLKAQQRQEIIRLVKRGRKTAADAARLFGVHPATVSRLLRAA